MTNVRSITETIQGLMFCVTDPSPAGWKGDNPLVIQGSIREIMIHRVYVNMGSSIDMIYEHCFRLLPDAWNEGLRPSVGQLTGFIGHSLWLLGTILLLFTLTSQDKIKQWTTLVDFVVIRHPSKHNVILGRTTLLKFGAILSTVHEIVKFSTSRGPGKILATPTRELKCYEIMQPKDISAEAKRPKPDSSSRGGKEEKK